MQVAFRLYLSSSLLGDVTETLLIHGVPKQEGRSCSHLMWHTAYAAQHQRHVRTLPRGIQGQQHGHSDHSKVAMTATLLHETPAGPRRRTWEAYLSKQLTRF